MKERIFIEQGIRRMQLEEYLKEQLYRAGFTKAELIKTPMVTRVIVHVVNPGLAIGKSGQNIKALTEELEKKFNLENVQMEIKQIENPILDAQVQADRIKTYLERGFNWSYRVVKDIMAANAQGVEIIVKGKLAGKGGRKKKQRVALGYIKKVGNQVKLQDFGKAVAYPKPGAIGIKVRPDVIFPDKVDFAEVLKKEEIEEKKKEKEEKKEEVEKNE